MRPPWLSTLITELWACGEGPNADFAVRLLYNGRVLRPCVGQQSTLCRWQDFSELRKWFQGVLRFGIGQRKICILAPLAGPPQLAHAICA
mmetsp:Transcript_91058/g.253536  ORF Transcript_91058/g.253536 Transcript_91058/m.253536 type:complete len:90 (+) Transcript_91058:388-657(+)